MSAGIVLVLVVFIDLSMVLEIFNEVTKFYVRPERNVKGGRMKGNG